MLSRHHQLIDHQCYQLLQHHLRHHLYRGYHFPYFRQHIRVPLDLSKQLHQSFQMVYHHHRQNHQFQLLRYYNHHLYHHL